MLRSLRIGCSCFDFKPRILRGNSNIIWKYQERTHPQWLQNHIIAKSRSTSGPHLICIEDWDMDMVMATICSAMNLKCACQNTHGQKMDLLKAAKVMILEDHDEPILRMAVSKATSLLGADEVLITNSIDWNGDYMGKVFSGMADVIFVSSKTEGCIRRFAEFSDVPILCIRSRMHASLQALATVMSIIEDYKTLSSLNVGYIGPPHQVLNDYLVLCPMLGANIKFKCCCNVCPVSPLLKKTSEELCQNSCTNSQQVTAAHQALEKVNAIIAGPTTDKLEKIPEFSITVEDIQKHTDWRWTYYHTCPRGKEVDDDLFFHGHSRTFNAFNNLQYVAASLMAFACQCHRF